MSDTLQSPPTEEYMLQRIAAKADIIRINEEMIDENDALYLITWSPDPAQLPDSDFDTQHEYNIWMLTTFLSSCKCGLFCLEATQRGNPHYHGWYQAPDDPLQTNSWIAAMKTMQRCGNVNLTPAKHWKINSYSKKKNALYYYKEDVFDQILMFSNNPITKDSVCHIDWDTTYIQSFFDKTIHTPPPEMISERKRLLKFYKKSL